MTEGGRKLVEILNRDNEHIYKNLINDLHALKSCTVLVTGAKGFLGKTVISFLDYVNKNKLQETERINIIAIDYEDFDICKPLHNFVKEDKIDYIINFAGIASPKKYLQKPVETLDVSYLGTKNVLELAKDRGTKSVLMFSSSEVYGTPDPENIPTGEEYVGSVTTFGNRSCYDIGKNVLETLSYVYHNVYNSPVNVIRPFNLYGPLMNTDDGRIIANICKSMINEAEFSIYGNGQQTRTYCYVADAVVFMLKVLLLGKFGEIYNIGSEEEELSAVEITQQAYGLINPDNSSYSIAPHPIDYPDNEPQRRKPDISKVKAATGYVPRYKFEDGFMSCFSAFEDILMESPCLD
jgi:UDP-glucuronate decarboxylase